MNELKFLKAMSMISDDLIMEAETDSEKIPKAKSAVSKGKICVLGYAAAAAVTIGVVFYNFHIPSYIFKDNSSVHLNSGAPNDDNGIPDIFTSSESSESSEDTQEKTEPDKSKSTESKNTKNSAENNTSIADGVTEFTDIPEKNADEKAEPDKSKSNESKNPKISDEDNTSIADGVTEFPDIPKKNADDKSKSDAKQNSEFSDNYFHVFEISIDNDSDSYGDDKVQNLSIIIAGNTYYQLDISEYSEYNIKSEISESDFGKYAGNVTELYGAGEPSDCAVSSNEPNLVGAEVYYYAPANSRSVIIVKKGEQCSIFAIHGMAVFSDSGVSDFAETFSF